MTSRLLLSAALVAVALPAWAQEAAAPPVPPSSYGQPPAVAVPLDEPPPNFDPVKPASPQDDSAGQPAPSAASAEPAPVVAPVAVAPAPEADPAAADDGEDDGEPDLPPWAVAVLVLLGAFLAGLFGVMTAMILRRGEVRQRRRAAAATLAIELETRRQAFETVPLPPNVEAGVSFVSATTALAGIDAGFRAAQGELHLLPEKLAAHVSVHYAAVQRVADFVKGQSLAAAVRMLQANRLGGYPCPDAGAMREAHEELALAFRGTDKLAEALRSVR